MNADWMGISSPISQVCVFLSLPKPACHFPLESVAAAAATPPRSSPPWCFPHLSATYLGAFPRSFGDRPPSPLGPARGAFRRVGPASWATTVFDAFSSLGRCFGPPAASCLVFFSPPFVVALHPKAFPGPFPNFPRQGLRDHPPASLSIFLLPHPPPPSVLPQPSVFPPGTPMSIPI